MHAHISANNEGSGCSARIAACPPATSLHHHVPPVAPFHLRQSIGKVAVDVRQLGVDTLTIVSCTTTEVVVVEQQHSTVCARSRPLPHWHAQCQVETSAVLATSIYRLLQRAQLLLL